MFIHLGADVTISAKKVIAMLDARRAKTGATLEFLTYMEEQGKLIRIEDKEVKSYVITDDCVYISPISATTLKKRAASVDTSNLFMP